MRADPAGRTLHSRSARRVCRAVTRHRSGASVRGCALRGLVAPRCSPPTAGGNQPLPVNRPPHGREKYQSVSAYWPLERRATPTETTFCCPSSSLSANSPWSRIFPVREPVAAWHFPRHFLSLTRLFHSLSASNSRSVRAIVCVAPTRPPRTPSCYL